MEYHTLESLNYDANDEGQIEERSRSNSLPSVSSLSTEAESRDVHTDRESRSTSRSISGGKSKKSIPVNKGILITPIGKRSTVWKNFKVWSNFPCQAKCNHCGLEIMIGKEQTPGHLDRHLKSVHADVKVDEIEKTLERGQEPLKNFVKFAPDFPKFLLIWIVMTYQSLSQVTNEFFRKMIHSLNNKVEFLGMERLTTMIMTEATRGRMTLKKKLEGEMFAATIDGWTSVCGTSFVAMTTHTITKDWKLEHHALGCFKKDGRSRAQDYLFEVIKIMQLFVLGFKCFVCVVTDTEPTMLAFGRMFSERSQRDGGHAMHHGCVDHILELTTSLAFEDSQASEDCMKKARALVGHFKHSSQANDSLLAVQKAVLGTIERAVTVIQDIVTRWWSTYQMCQRLLRLKQYFTLLVDAEKLDADVNLNPNQWRIIEDICGVLKPFMIVQKTLEGENYVTISLVPYLISEIRVKLKKAIENENGALSDHAVGLAIKMLENFNSHWGSGENGSIYDEHETLGPRGRPKGFTIYQMWAALLDPRMKLLTGFGEADKTKLKEKLLEAIKAIARKTNEERRQERQQQENDEVLRQQQGVQEDGAAADDRRMRQRRADTDDDDDDENIWGALNADRVAAVLPQAVPPDAAYENLDANIEAEFRQYLDEPPLPMKCFNDVGASVHTNPLEWWKEHERKYPHIAMLARWILAIPATSAPSERLFSAAGLTIANDRSRLTPHLAADLIFLHDVYPSLYPEAFA